ncbi:hypothetical protein DRN69_04120 [Candidatus Pacearchaeota archaeon]|nr:MAG: hypothetical protein DRN69_04120 [Candidatus Pacearchaeota archaeon]
MIKGVVFASAFLGGTFTDILSSWEELGVFNYLLPFLLIFSLIFGILTKIRLFKDNKAINAIIALSVALMSLQFSRVTEFFSEIVPRMGIALLIILAILILLGIFIDPKNNVINYVLLGIGVVIILVVLVQTAGSLGWQSGQWWSDNWPMLLGIIALFVLIIIVISASGGGGKEGREPPAYFPIWARDTGYR